MSKKNHRRAEYYEAPKMEVTEPTEVEIKEEEIIEETKVEEPVLGVVTNCLKLNVRKRPIATAEIVCEVTCLTEVSVDLDKSKGDFYKVTLASGVEGFCMKK